MKLYEYVYKSKYYYNKSITVEAIGKKAQKGKKEPSLVQ